MIGLLLAGLVVAVLAVFILWSGRPAPEATDPEEALETAAELHRIRRRFDTEAAKAEIRSNARDIERQILRELDDEP